MSEISVDQYGMERLLRAQNDAIDEIKKALDAMPGAVDGGMASAMIGLLMTNAAEVASVVAGPHRALVAIAADVLDDLGTTEQQVQDDIDQFRGGMAQ
jgi:hypothetical protein